MKKILHSLFTLFFLLGFAPLVNTAQAQTANDWPQFQANPQHTGYNAAEIALKPPLAPLWSVPFTPQPVIPYFNVPAQTLTPEAAVSDNTLYFQDWGGKLSAVDTATGQVKWQAATCGAGNGVAVAGSTVFAGRNEALGSNDFQPPAYCPYTADSALNGYDTLTGQMSWYSAYVDYGFPAFIVTDDMAIGVYGGSATKMNTTTPSGSGTAGIGSGNNGVGPYPIAPGAPAYNNGIAYVAGRTGSLFATDALADWNSPTPPVLWANYTLTDKFTASPTYANNTVYIGSEDGGGVYAVDAATGQLEWNALSGATIKSTIAVANNVLYVETTTGQIYALDATSHTILWTNATPQGAGLTDVLDNYFWNDKFSGTSSIAVANGVVYAGSADKNIYAFDAGTGNILWQYTLSGSVGTPIVAEGKLFVPTADGKIYAFGSIIPVGQISASPNPVQVNSSLTASATFTDPGATSYTTVWDWGDGTTSPGTVTGTNGSETASDSHTYSATGIYTITLSVTDSNGSKGSSTYQYEAVYDPTPQGLFTGARLFTSPAGAYSADASLTGQAQFGIVAKYSGSAPTGNATMNFPAANFKFVETTISTLVIANGKATLQGSGTVNGTSGYTFAAVGLQNNLIRFQIKDANGTVVYDTQSGAALTADPTTTVTGQVIIH